ncbi:MAG TPA: hypothetical protein VJ552_06900 [Sediminibacterium sp.]|nr:hypothetical protein [Sediminibacterium sp.]
MPSTSAQEVSKLKLDLKNYRTVPQKKEKDAIKAMITIKPDRFNAVIKSIIENGFLPTENIIVLKDGDTLTVKEGNRRIAALKLIHGEYKVTDFDLPVDIISLIKGVDPTWKKDNLKIPCAIYSKSESEIAEKVVALAHGKGEQASRDKWTSVATARHNRDAKGIAEPALDLLEKYIKNGKNLTDDQKERWAGDYPVTVLAEAMRFLYSRLGFNTLAEFVNKYPKISELPKIENLMRDIGLEQIGFKQIRDEYNDFAINYGFAPIVVAPPASSSTNKEASEKSTSVPPASSTQTGSSGTASSPTSASPPSTTPTAKKAVATNDPKHLAALLKSFIIKGNNRDKVVALREEMKKLDISKTPMAFCFLLRSMFEISAKAYCADSFIGDMKPAKNGKPAQSKTLAEVLSEVTKHITANTTDKVKVKLLHGALTEISKPTGILSVTSLNQLVHNASFSIIPSDICTLFSNVFPLLQEMN